MKTLAPVFSLLLCLPSFAAAYTGDPVTNACLDLSYLKDAPARLEERDNAYLTLGVIGVGAFLYSEDRQILKIIQKNKSSAADNMQKTVGDIGNGAYEMGLMGVFVGTSYIIKDQKLRDTSFMAAESFLAANAIGTVTKVVVGRGRPYYGHGKDAFSLFSFKGSNASFPSGHSTSAFSVASVFAASYDSPVIGILSYGAATAVALQRVYTNNHWPSDVFIGAVLGTVTGRAVVRISKERALEKKSVVLLPVFQPGYSGVTALARF